MSPQARTLLSRHSKMMINAIISLCRSYPFDEGTGASSSSVDVSSVGPTMALAMARVAEAVAVESDAAAEHSLCEGKEREEHSCKQTDQGGSH